MSSPQGAETPRSRVLGGRFTTCEAICYVWRCWQPMWRLMAEGNVSNEPSVHGDAIESARAGLAMGEASLGVSTTSFLTAVGFFFIGLLLTGDKSLQLDLRVPLAFLFISAFGFLYSTLVYANASGEIARLNKHNFDRQMCVGNALSEYLGVYCLAFAAPLAVLGYSPDKVLSIVVFAISLSGWLLYHLLGYSILERYVTGVRLRLVVFGISAVYACAFFASYARWDPLSWSASGALAVAVVWLTVMSIRRGTE